MCELPKNSIGWLVSKSLHVNGCPPYLHYRELVRFDKGYSGHPKVRIQILNLISHAPNLFKNLSGSHWLLVMKFVNEVLGSNSSSFFKMRLLDSYEFYQKINEFLTQKMKDKDKLRIEIKLPTWNNYQFMRRNIVNRHSIRKVTQNGYQTRGWVFSLEKLGLAKLKL